ncbi:MAG TPA: outer membrane beta-barrel domain-containing protein [Spongiibacteraceae bacterium]|jgi:outer membrane beta-barrel protein|nr:outer membrane beta-barrel domain-containing protein [Spongiibacteraceae bacterium]HUH37657.1 outer membrane beta-barrel domain-containing protein [Spongiibacteraceae bacterium]
MENRLQRIFLSSLIALAPAALAQSEDGLLDRIVEPDLERREIRENKIDSENFEAGIWAGYMNVEDFGSNPVYGLRLAFHITEDLFVEANYGMTDTRETSFEKLSGSVQLLTDDERELSFYNVAVGWNVLPGEVFIGSKWAFNSALYLVAGVGNTEFAGDTRFTWHVGAGYRLFLTDWLSVNVDVRNHVFDIDLFGVEETTNNFESHLGINLFF